MLFHGGLWKRTNLRGETTSFERFCSVFFSFAFDSLSVAFLPPKKCDFHFTSGEPVISGFVLVFVAVFILEMGKTEQLIELVRNHRILYDLAHEDYRNIRKKDNIWDQIGTELGETGKFCCCFIML